MKILIKFVCEKVDYDKDCGEGVARVHLKGYASRICETYLPPMKCIDKLKEFDEIVFDGDDFAIDSFTKLLPMFLALSAAKEEKSISLRAFKYADYEGQFLSSWHNRTVAVELQDGVEHCVFGLSDKGVKEAEVGGPENEKVVIAPIYYSTLYPSDFGFKPSGNKWLDLGRYALLKTGAMCVLTAGSGECVKLEFEHSVLHSDNIKWFVWNFTRQSLDGLGVESAALQGVKHERLTELLTDVD
jgi:hypothetical protein